MLSKHPSKYAFESLCKYFHGTDWKTVADESKDLGALHFDRLLQTALQKQSKNLTSDGESPIAPNLVNIRYQLSF